MLVYVAYAEIEYERTLGLEYVRYVSSSLGCIRSSPCLVIG